MIYYYPSEVISQDAIFSQFYANPLYLNPALAGMQACPRLDINYRNHPYPDFGHFSTYSASYQQRWDPVSGGIGLLVTSEHFGEMIMRHYVGGVYSYHAQLTREKHLSFGINAAYFRKDLRWDNLVFSDQYDPFTGNINPTDELPPDNTEVHDLDVAAGILFYSDNFFAGIAGHHLTEPQRTFFLNESMPMKLTFHGGAKFQINKHRRDLRDISFSPNIILQHQDDFLRTNYGMYFDVEPITTGIWFRQDFKGQKVLIFLLGLYKDEYRIGYSFDHSLSGSYPNNAGIHEISVSLNFDCKEEKMFFCPNF